MAAQSVFTMISNGTRFTLAYGFVGIAITGQMQLTDGSSSPAENIEGMADDKAIYFTRWSAGSSQAYKGRWDGTKWIGVFEQANVTNPHQARGLPWGRQDGFPWEATPV
jgi:hypothetical protein